MYNSFIGTAWAIHIHIGFKLLSAVCHRLITGRGKGAFLNGFFGSAPGLAVGTMESVGKCVAYFMATRRNPLQGIMQMKRKGNAKTFKPF